MKTNAAFWDTSAVVPLCVFQDATAAARRTRRRFSGCALWWGSTVEINNSLSRLKREGFLQQGAFIVSRSKLADFQRPARIIQPTKTMLDVAVELPEKFGLRSLDAFQLASALVWCRERPRNRPFVTADGRLGGAAESVGFELILLS